ncbi:hypothetical protein GCM10007857_67230 [Bradyrhizobium iriomotense]|uniref:Uncharacterized protein n=1 Tax=Bradyrhizobium iriomotense TaxID=441950 RepID=A0ABQ6B6G3_9BRAD|nr:hypothetical protein GCM10007857_67230 [Bradyrhizobium iriomotense]
MAILELVSGVGLAGDRRYLFEILQFDAAYDSTPSEQLVGRNMLILMLAADASFARLTGGPPR